MAQQLQNCMHLTNMHICIHIRMTCRNLLRQALFLGGTSLWNKVVGKIWRDVQVLIIAWNFSSGDLSSFFPRKIWKGRSSCLTSNTFFFLKIASFFQVKIPLRAYTWYLGGVCQAISILRPEHIYRIIGNMFPFSWERLLTEASCSTRVFAVDWCSSE